MAQLLINDSSILSLTKRILQASTSLQASFVQKTVKDFIKQTEEFKEEYQKTNEKIFLFQEQMKDCIKQWYKVKSSLSTSQNDYKNTTQYENYLESRQLIRENFLNKEIKKEILNTYKNALLFQKYLNAFLGQEIKTAYVWVGQSHIPETYLIQDMSDFLTVDINRYGDIVVRYINNQQMLKEHTEKIENQIRDTLIFNYDGLKSTYQKVYQRYNEHHIKKGGSFVLWLNPNQGQKWHGVYISSLGSVNQTYGKLLLHEKFTYKEARQDDIEQFMNTLLGVTNLSGTLQGDTMIKNINIALKSSGATTLSIKQLYDISSDIINNKINNFNSIYNYLIKKKENNKNNEKKINVSVNEALKNYTNQLEDTLVAFLKANS